ncbi:MAG: AAA family ATPase [Candidatus Lokiarchaeia archaeon]
MNLKIEKIEIFHFFSYVRAKFSNLNNYNVLIGKNNSGKSNLFKIFRMLKENYQNGTFSSINIYENNEEVEASIILGFKISKTIREELLQKLYLGKYLHNAFLSSESLEGYLKRNEWNKKKKAIQWLIDQGCYSKIYVEIKHSKIIKNIYISQISIKHEKIGTQILLKANLADKANQTIIPDIKKLIVKGKTIQNFFTDSPNSNIGSVSSNLKSFYGNLHIFSNDPVLSTLLTLLKNNFFDIILLIPDKRKFNKDSDKKNIVNTKLEPNGENLAKFIHMKKVLNQDQWLSEFNKELHEYLPDIITVEQMVNQLDRTYLIFKEKEINVDLLIENEGAGILNIIHFLVYIKELKENKILFIEEPELHLHPGLETKLRDKFINISDKIQIFITTHSREFLPENDDKSSVYLLKKEHYQSIVNLIPEERYEEIYRNLDIDIDKYRLQKSLMYNEEFWIKFIRKSMEDKRVEQELWDFKQTIDFWKIKDNLELTKSKIKFCQDIACFANNQGGVLIIGITNNYPRKIIGLEYESLENRIRDLHVLIRDRTNYHEDFVEIQQIKIKDENNKEKICLVIAIAQTLQTVGVEQFDGSIIYKKRIGPSCETVNPNEIRKNKQLLYSTNSEYLLYLKSFTENNQLVEKK